MIIKQIYNNNVILSENEAGDEIILVGRELPSGCPAEARSWKGGSKKKFELQDDVGRSSRRSYRTCPTKTILVSEEIIDYIKTQSTKRINDSIYVTLTDPHRQHARTGEDGHRLRPQLLCSTSSRCIKKNTGWAKGHGVPRAEIKINIDDGEASFIALHIINAELDSNMRKMYGNHRGD